jgi:hypothetical protein
MVILSQRVKRHGKLKLFRNGKGEEINKSRFVMITKPNFVGLQSEGWGGDYMLHVLLVRIRFGLERWIYTDWGGSMPV